MKKSAFVMAFSLVFISAFGLVFNVHATDDRLTTAYEYILSRYNPALGLVSESEDGRVNVVNGTSVNNTYWIYGDNLWAAEALRPYRPGVAANISMTVQSYVEEYGRSMVYEVALGEVIPTTIHGKRNIEAFSGTVNGSWVQILLERHQYVDDPEGIFYDAEEYTDLCFYLTIDYWLMDDIHASEHWFRNGEGLWNYSTNKGFYDKAAREAGLYRNAELGLFMLTKNVTGFPSNITSGVEEAVWSYQRENGGIASLSYLNGTVRGTADVETTSALLLAYACINDKYEQIVEHHPMEHFKTYEDRITVFDNRLGRYIDLRPRPQDGTLWCDYCKKPSCCHTTFLAQLPDLMKTLERRGWKLDR